MRYLIILFFALIPLIGNCKETIETSTNSKDSTLNIESNQLKYHKHSESSLRRNSTVIREDEFLPENTPKSSLYIYIEKRMREELSIDEKTAHSKFPLIVVDNQARYLKDLNNIEYGQTTKITVLSGDIPSTAAIYGTRALNGIILIETK
ncbi:hypothetical protein CLV62_11412 [Dysgonomonas alginatilytica]|uniref:TonB-dependent SusC/RagA subfamily outer membrane receptor n=1 Tax=Dysgonomonas alginatilytica TaxID=1605892 RepID=A0A2V3PPF0_9BACT|nr:hypothetical protein [Dysgonomonas alginatilytica]PXV63295.1 hypothetical protein CLV62_11412 [Dysgonomonas alginatilytica]